MASHHFQFSEFQSSIYQYIEWEREWCQSVRFRLVDQVVNMKRERIMARTCRRPIASTLYKKLFLGLINFRVDSIYQVNTWSHWTSRRQKYPGLVKIACWTTRDRFTDIMFSGSPLKSCGKRHRSFFELQLLHLEKRVQLMCQIHLLLLLFYFV